MSRRYGRNQKRRAREELANVMAMADYRLKANAESLRMIQGVLQEKRDALAAVADSLGPAFVGLPLNELMLRIFDVAYAEDAPDSFASVPPGASNPVIMHVLKMSAHDDLVRDRVHVRVRLAGGDTAYALSEAAIRQMPADALARNLGRHIAEFLVSELVKRGVRR